MPTVRFEPTVSTGERPQNYALDRAATGTSSLCALVGTNKGLGTHQLLVYVDDINILGGSVHAVKRKARALVVDSEEIGVEVNADRTKYMAMSRDQNAGRSHSIMTDNSSFENVEEFKYLGKVFTNQNSIPGENLEKIKVRECLPSFGAVSFVFQFAISKLKD